MGLLNQIWVNLIIFIFLLFFSVSAIPESIDINNVDQTKIYYGFVENFSTVAEVKYETIIKNTKQYKEIQDRKIQEGTGKYWILMSEASDNTITVIRNYAIQNNYDLILESNYFQEIYKKENITVTDITQNILDSMN